MGAISGNLACAPPPGEQPPSGPHHRVAQSRTAHGVASDGHLPVGHQRYRKWSYRGLENLGFWRFWRFWPKSTLSGPMHTQFPYRWWPTDTGPPEGTPGAARDGAARRWGAWGGCPPGGGAQARFLKSPPPLKSPKCFVNSRLSVNLASKKIQKLREHNRPSHINKVVGEVLEHV